MIRELWDKHFLSSIAQSSLPLPPWLVCPFTYACRVRVVCFSILQISSELVFSPVDVRISVLSLAMYLAVVKFLPFGSNRE